MPPASEQPPWWGWTFVAAVPLGILALFAPWFELAALPAANGAAQSFGAFSGAPTGVLGPVFTTYLGGLWLGAQAGWCALPGSTRAWLGSRGPLGRLGSDAATTDPVRAACVVTSAVGAATLLLFAFGRAVLPTSATIVDVRGNLPNLAVVRAVTLQFGGWCDLLAGTLFLVVGALATAFRGWTARVR